MTVTPDVAWVKSRRCDSNACLEVADLGEHVAVRNSTNPNGGVAQFTKHQWQMILDGVVEDGDFFQFATQGFVGDSR
jgi:hypothetical protein